MVTFEEAKAIALSLNHRVDTCNEYAKAYHFFILDDDSVGDCGVVIMKDSGKAIHFASFILNEQPETNPKRIDTAMNM